jgi:hypothetical protein
MSQSGRFVVTAKSFTNVSAIAKINKTVARTKVWNESFSVRRVFGVKMLMQKAL